MNGLDSRLPGRGAVAPLILIAIIARTFRGIAIEYGDAMNASWMAPVASLVLLIPLALAVHCTADRTVGAPWAALIKGMPKWISSALSAVIGLMLIFDCAVNMRVMATTANVVALTDMPVFMLMLPIAAVVGYAVARGADGIGFAARIYLYIAAALIIVMVAVQWSAYRPGWLFPIFGGGGTAIADGAQVCAGWGALIVLTALVSIPDRSRHVLTRVALIAMGVSAALLLTVRMLIPAMPDAQLAQSVKSEMLFSNGRVALALQMLLIVLWDGSLLYLICAEAVTASCYFSFIRNDIPAWALGAAIGGFTLIMANTAAQNRALSHGMDRFLFIGIGALIAALMLIQLISEKKKICQD